MKECVWEEDYIKDYIEWLESMVQTVIDEMDAMCQEEMIESDYPNALQKILDNKKEEFRSKH